MGFRFRTLDQDYSAQELPLRSFELLELLTCYNFLGSPLHRNPEDAAQSTWGCPKKHNSDLHFPCSALALPDRTACKHLQVRKLLRRRMKSKNKIDSSSSNSILPMSTAAVTSWFERAGQHVMLPEFYCCGVLSILTLSKQQTNRLQPFSQVSTPMLASAFAAFLWLSRSSNSCW